MSIKTFLRSLCKFLDGKIGQSHLRVYQDDARMDYPSVTICSGYRDADLRVIHVAQENVNATDLPDDFLDWEHVRRLTYDKEEYINFFTQAFENNWDRNYLLEDDFWTEEFHPQYGGRCATFNPEQRTPPHNLNSITFSLMWQPDRNAINIQKTSF